MNDLPDWIDEVQFDERGLVPVIAQEAGSRDVLMFAFMNREALEATVNGGTMVYYSRSRQRLWRKGEESGHLQRVVELRLDCDADVILATVEQVGGIACHTGRHRCFYRRLVTGEDPAGWIVDEPVLVDPKVIYR